MHKKGSYVNHYIQGVVGLHYSYSPWHKVLVLIQFVSKFVLHAL